MDLELPNVSITRFSRGYVDEDDSKDDSEDSSDKDIIVVQPDIILDEYEENESDFGPQGSEDFGDDEDNDDDEEDDEYDGSRSSDDDGFEIDASLAELCTTEHSIVDNDLPEVTIEPKSKQISFSSPFLTTSGINLFNNQVFTLGPNQQLVFGQPILPSGTTISAGDVVMERPYKCNVCEKAFRYNSDLKKHFRTHTGERPYQCKLCLKSFTRSSHLAAHNRVHTGERPYECTLCDKKFKDKSILARHKRLHNEKNFECGQCEKVFLKVSELRIHERQHQPQLPTFKCDECDKEFQYSLHLDVHKKTHIIQQQLQMIQSDAVTIIPKIKPAAVKKEADVTPLLMKQEIKSEESAPLSTSNATTTLNSFSCNLCKTVFPSEMEMKKHKRSHVTTTDRPYPCAVCGKAFSCFSQLEIHNRVHTGELPYRCDICNKLFNQRSNLQTHKKRHLGTHVNKCLFCDKHFSTSKTLKNHLREHQILLYEKKPIRIASL